MNEFKGWVMNIKRIIKPDDIIPDFFIFFDLYFL